MYTYYFGPFDPSTHTPPLSSLEQMARMLQQGQLVAFPTETLYALSGSILNKDAIKQMYTIKKRPLRKPLPILIASLQQVRFLASDIPKTFYRLAERFFPGPLTLILKKHPQFSSQAVHTHQTVAIRFSSNTIAHRLVEMTGCPLATTSANLSGKPSSTKATHVLEDFNGLISAICDGGESHYGIETTILSLEDPQNPLLLRQGVISKYAIEETVGAPIRVHPSLLIEKDGTVFEDLKLVVRLFSSWSQMGMYLKLSDRGKRLVMSQDLSPFYPIHDHFTLKMNNLYEGLRFAQKGGYGEVLVHCPTEMKKNEWLHTKLKQIAKT